MPEHKAKKDTVAVSLSLLDRLTVRALIRSSHSCGQCGRVGYAPKDRDDERKWRRSWRAIELDEVDKELAPNPGTPPMEIQKHQEEALAKVRKFELSIEKLETLIGMPVADTVERGVAISGIRERFEEARDKLKALGLT